MLKSKICYDPSLRGGGFCSICLALLLALEACYVQAMALAPDFAGAIGCQHMQRLFLMNLAAALIMAALPRFFIYLAVIIQFALSVFIVSYVANLGTPPTFSAVFNGYAMVEATNQSFWGYLVKLPAVVLLLLAILKFYLAWRRSRVFKLRLIMFLAGALILTVCYIYDYHKGRLDILQKIKVEDLENPVVRSMRYRGFVVTWIMEYIRDVPNRHQAVYEEVGCDAKAVSDLPQIPISSRISLIQVESLDWAVLFKEIDGLEVSPNLNAMARRSLLLKLDGVKHFVSANSEYEMLNSKEALAYFLYFEYLSIYNDSIVLPFRRAGYETAFIHGVTGEYMNRTHTYPRLGFEHNLYFEQLQERGVKVTPGMFKYNIADYDLLDFAGQYTQGKDHYFHFIITVTMHGDVPAQSPQYESWHGYWRSVNYFDKGLGHYIDSLPEGSTVILYGDHQSYHGLEKNELVPFLVYIKGQDISQGDIPPQVFSRCQLSHYLRQLFARHLATNKL